MMNAQLEGKKICFLTSAHTPKDDRIYHHLASTCVRYGMKAIICSSMTDLQEYEPVRIDSTDQNAISKQLKISWFRSRLHEYEPDIIIGSEPLPLQAANQYAKNKEVKVLYDVTEWYPSKKQLAYTSIFLKPLKYLMLYLFHLSVSSKVHGFIIGERSKEKPYITVFPRKPKIRIGYYPDLDFLKRKSEKKSRELVLGYSGKISKEKGFGHVMAVADGLRTRVEKKLTVKVIGKIWNEQDERDYQNLLKKYPEVEVQKQDFVPYEEFSASIQDFDYALDLRKLDRENHLCLPIKVYFYAGCGIPTIYSGLDAIRMEKGLDEFCYLVDPKDHLSIINRICELEGNRKEYESISKKGIKKINESYNWGYYEPKFLNFLAQFIS